MTLSVEIKKKTFVFFEEIENTTISFWDLLTFSVSAILIFEHLMDIPILILLGLYFYGLFKRSCGHVKLFFIGRYFSIFNFFYIGTYTLQYYPLRYGLLESRFFQEVFYGLFQSYICSMHGWRPARMTTCVINQVAKRASM